MCPIQVGMKEWKYNVRINSVIIFTTNSTAIEPIYLFAGKALANDARILVNPYFGS
jgi:hypothetical protein